MISGFVTGPLDPPDDPPDVSDEEGVLVVGLELPVSTGAVDVSVELGELGVSAGVVEVSGEGVGSEALWVVCVSGWVVWGSPVEVL